MKQSEEAGNKGAQWPGVGGTDKAQQTVAQRIGLVGQDSTRTAGSG